MNNDLREPILLKDYTAPAYRTTKTRLWFTLEPGKTLVRSVLSIDCQGDPATALELSGEHLITKAVRLNGIDLKPGEDLAQGTYHIDGGRLSIASPGQRFELEIETQIDPAGNKALSGLYISNGIFCTQCEAEGFRRITWFQDRPDVLSIYEVYIEADKNLYPYLLSNGNLVETGSLENGKHFARWQDPHLKPSYLFALVAGDLALVQDEYKTASGRKVALHFYTEKGKEDQCLHGVQSLKKSMAWDEETFGLEYDLDLYQIVAVSDFNMGAMENKGLNVFNTAAALASPKSATDADFNAVERIIAHEYFHNWTGNRITCRDWFQLTLKEGLTVLRDQLFCEDMHGFAIKRIGEVSQLIEGQFLEDSSPLAHPIRPESYLEINNFYTRTVYDKGAEVIRMIRVIIGEDNFRKGMDLYVQRHDGQAVTCEDFVKAMADASSVDLTHFFKWYSQAGTPVLKATYRFEEQEKALVLEFEQIHNPTPGQIEKSAVPIPVRTGLLDQKTGEALRFTDEGGNETLETVLIVDEDHKSFSLKGVGPGTIPSVLRGFSAPVLLDIDFDDQDLALILTSDKDLFNRFDAGQKLFKRSLNQSLQNIQDGQKPTPAKVLFSAFSTLLTDVVQKNSELDPAFVARTLQPPSRQLLAQEHSFIDVEGLVKTYNTTRHELGLQLQSGFSHVYEHFCTDAVYAPETGQMAARSLKNTALSYLMATKEDSVCDLAISQYEQSDNMTDQLAALRNLTQHFPEKSEPWLKKFYDQWKDEDLVLNKWFSIQAMIEDDLAVERIKSLMTHPDFSITNPNRLRSLIGVFMVHNMQGFHQADGSGYALVARLIATIDPLNPQVASRLLAAFTRFRRYDEKRSEMMQNELQTIMNIKALSPDCFEIASKSLAAS